MPSVYIRSKHESLSTLHGAMCVNFLNRFPNALLEDFEKVLKIYIPASRTRTLKSDALKIGFTFTVTYCIHYELQS